MTHQGFNERAAQAPSKRSPAPSQRSSAPSSAGPRPDRCALPHGHGSVSVAASSSTKMGRRARWTKMSNDEDTYLFDQAARANLCDLDAREVARRLSVGVSTLNGWLKTDDERPPGKRVFRFHRWRGSARRWSECGFLELEEAIHRESECGVLAASRHARGAPNLAPPDPEAEAALARVLGKDYHGARSR